MTQTIIGKLIKIIDIGNDPSAAEYNGKTGVVTKISKGPYGENMYWGTWGGIALFDGEFEVIGTLSDFAE